MDELVEELRIDLHRAIDSQNQEECLKISMVLDEVILAYMKSREERVE